MFRKLALSLLIALALGAAIVAGLYYQRPDAASIHEYGRVYYSTPQEWADFYLKRAPSDTGWVHLPPPTDQRGLFRSNVDPALLGFVRAEVCGECHREHYESQKATAHFHTSSEATPDTVLGKFDAQAGRLPTRDPHLHFEMISGKDGLYQRVVVENDGETFQHAARFDIVTGSGNHGQTYLYWHGDTLLQLPISFFSELGGWINSPGQFRDGTADFARPIGQRCLDCHATFFATDPNAAARFDRHNYVLGVTCVRCHGHGWAHVQYHRTHPDDMSARYIVQPGNLPRDRANEVCAQCHSGVGQSVQPAFTYQPGEPLSDYIRLSNRADDTRNDDPHAANQLARLMKSRCYQGSENLTCASCHDPHREERGELKLFTQRCAKCHESSDCKLQPTHPQIVAERCVECHMPSRRDVEGVMQTPEGELLPSLRDHYIKVWPEVAEQVLSKVARPSKEQ